MDAMAIKAVFFDFYGTLAGFHPPKEEVQAQAMASMGFHASREGIIQGYLEADRLMSEVNSTASPVREMSHQERLEFFARYEQLILKGAGMETDLETAGKVWAKVQAVPHDFALFNDTLPTLQVLRDKGLTVGLISNIGANATNLTAQLGLTGHLDFIVTPIFHLPGRGRGGMEKPHPPIFRLALARASVKPEEALPRGGAGRPSHRQAPVSARGRLTRIGRGGCAQRAHRLSNKAPAHRPRRRDVRLQRLPAYNQPRRGHGVPTSKVAAISVMLASRQPVDYSPPSHP